MCEKRVLKISHMEESTELLGPFDRFVIWVHGCCFDCEGCLAVNTKNGAFEEIEVSRLARRIAESSCEGITVSGGEPFLQAAALLELIKEVKSIRDIGVIIYSGFTMDEIKNDDRPFWETKSLKEMSKAPTLLSVASTDLSYGSSDKITID